MAGPGDDECVGRSNKKAAWSCPQATFSILGPPCYCGWTVTVRSTVVVWVCAGT